MLIYFLPTACRIAVSGGWTYRKGDKAVWKDEARRMKFEQGMSWNEIAQALKSNFPGCDILKTKDKIRDYLRRLPEYNVGRSDAPQEEWTNTKMEYKASDGTTTFEGIVALMDGEAITPEIIMKAHKLDSSTFEVVTYKTNFWQAQAKGGRKLLLYQSKIVVRPKTKNKITFEDIDKYFAKKDYSKGKLPTAHFNYDENGEVLEICLPDLHIGLLSWRVETGEDYDIKIARENFFLCINDIRQRCENRKLKKIVFVTLGDLLHIDNNKQETTNGTPQQADGRLEKIVECAEDMLIDGITILGDIAPVEVIYISGNHDRETGYMLHRSVMNAFRRDTNITFDITPSPQKARLLGKALIGWCHGDMPKKNNEGWLQNDYRADFGQCLFAEVHSGHYHSNQTTEANTGIIVRYLPKLCSASYWENKQGYRAGKAMVCFVWNEKIGLRDMWINNI